MNVSDREDDICQYIRDRAPVFYLELGTDGRIARSNAFTIRLVGREVVGLTFEEIAVDFPGALDPLRLARDGEEKRLVNIARKEGLPQSLHCSFREIPGGVLVLGVIDVGEQETLRRQVIGLNRDLGVLTRHLQKSNAELARLNELKNQFLGMAAHDLRKPLGLIVSYAEFLEDEAAALLDTEQKGFLSRIQSAAAGMRELINDFLDVAMIESGKLDIETTPMSLSDVLKQALEVVNVQARRKSVTVEAARAPAMPPLLLDGPKMEQVLTNLISNAVEFSAEGQSVRVRTRFDGETATVEVRDHGPGIAPEDAERLFHAYQRTSAKKTAGERSSGLGLVIARKIVEAHGGRILVRSEPGRGATFIVEIPANSQEANET